ncbi:MAG: heavy metal translocating P-type ATPase [bacterium]
MQTHFIVPGLVLVCLILGIFHVPYVFLLAVCIGLFKIVTKSYEEIREGRYSLDYVAFLAMVVSIVSHEYLAGGVIALMYTGGEALEAFANGRAYAALKSLGDTIPKYCLVATGPAGDGGYDSVAIQEVEDGDRVLIKRGEIVPLDGTVVSTGGAVLSMANLTGESDPVSLKKGTFVKSGAVNAGESFDLDVVGDFSSSTYHKIAQLVEEAKANPAPLVRMSSRANAYFTFATFLFAGIAYVVSDEITRALAVLVIATPCPLIIAAPAAFIGGMSRLARSGIILRKSAAFEGLQKAKKIFFDKTGTLTMGEPSLRQVHLLHHQLKDEAEALAIAAAIEIHSLHPLAQALVVEARRRGVEYTPALNVAEKIGEGISGEISGQVFSLKRASAIDDEDTSGIILALSANGVELAHFIFADELKAGVGTLFSNLSARGAEIEIITGDSKANAEAVFAGFGVTVRANVSPEDKYRLVEAAHKQGQGVVMIGDGLNDAPALARADVGVVFSGSENGASIEVSDVVILDHRIEKLDELFAAAEKTVRVARQSIYGGIALSVIGMAFAAFGYIPPVTGAFIQEGIDIIVILNALRTLRA